MTGILDGIRVVEWAIWHAGPGGTSMLGDLGAEVIKIERPKVGDEERSLSGPLARSENRIGDTSSLLFETSNRNKKSITIDLSKPQGREIAYKLIQTADVFMQNWRGGVVDKMGMDYKTLVKYNPKLIYCNVNTYGPFGPDAGRRGMDYVGLARSSMMTMPVTNDGEPPHITTGIADQITTMVTAYAIATALLARERHGIGQEIDVSITGSGAILNHFRIYEQSIGQVLGREFVRRQTRKTSRNPIGNHYKCKDGKWLALGGNAADITWPDNCKALGIEHLQNDPRFVNSAMREKNNEELIKILDEVMATKTRAEWLEIIKPYRRIMHAPVNEIEDLFTDPQIVENRYIVEQDHPILGKLPVTGFPVNYRTTPAKIYGGAPALSEHTEGLLLKLGYSQNDIKKLKEEEVI